MCNQALELNSRLIDSEQFEYHESLKANFKIIKEQLQEILSERVSQQSLYNADFSFYAWILDLRCYDVPAE